MMSKFETPADLVDVWQAKPTAETAAEIREFLRGQGTFTFPTLANGLFPAGGASAAGNPQARDGTGYDHVWIRDNIHVANAIFEDGGTEVAVRNLEGMLLFMESQQVKMEAILAGETGWREDSMKRPHIRFIAKGPQEETEQSWSHAQNDALGILLWFAAKVLATGRWQASEAQLRTLSLVARTLHATQFWQDADSGHWEEKAKVEASSIGIALHALRLWQRMDADVAVLEMPAADLQEAIDKGQKALDGLLPRESEGRESDAALVFLMHPVPVLPVDHPLAKQILENTQRDLVRERGVCRYVGDSYWCADFAQRWKAGSLTDDVTDVQEERDKLWHPGEEAEWTLFDPILAMCYAQLGERELMVEAISRSLRALTTGEHGYPAWRLPESYTLVDGQRVPNPITPLLWSQANLLLALNALAGQ